MNAVDKILQRTRKLSYNSLIRAYTQKVKRLDVDDETLDQIISELKAEKITEWERTESPKKYHLKELKTENLVEYTKMKRHSKKKLVYFNIKTDEDFEYTLLLDKKKLNSPKWYNLTKINKRKQFNNLRDIIRISLNKDNNLLLLHDLLTDNNPKKMIKNYYFKLKISCKGVHIGVAGGNLIEEDSLNNKDYIINKNAVKIANLFATIDMKYNAYVRDFINSIEGRRDNYLNELIRFKKFNREAVKNTPVQKPIIPERPTIEQLIISTNIPAPPLPKVKPFDQQDVTQYPNSGRGLLNELKTAINKDTSYTKKEQKRVPQKQ